VKILEDQSILLEASQQDE